MVGYRFLCPFPPLPLMSLIKIITIDDQFPDPDNPLENPDKVARYGLIGSDVCYVGIFNNLPGSVTLDGFQLMMFGSIKGESVLGPSTAEEWTDRSYAGVIQHGNPVNPITLPAGEKMYFILERMKGIHSIQPLVKCSAGESGKVKLEFGRGPRTF